ncbi:MAG: hypoxanthine phosphoribosyltransferase [Thermoguttaceae bacterium]
MKTLINEEQLREGIDRLAKELRTHYEGRPLTIVGVLIGSVVFLADLIRRIDLPLRLELVQARSYRGNSTRPGPLVLNLDLLSSDVRGRDVLLVDDIFDTGNTLWELLPQIDELGPASVRTAVLLRKQGRCEVPMKPHHVAFDIPNVFVVGYGLDHRDMYRNLPYVAELEPSELVESGR